MENKTHVGCNCNCKRGTRSRSWNVARWILWVLVVLALLKFLCGGMGRGGMMMHHFMDKSSMGGKIEKVMIRGDKRIMNPEMQSGMMTVTTTTQVLETTGASN